MPPEIPEPELGQYMNGRRFGTAVIYGDLHQHIIHIPFCIFNITIKIPVLPEYPGVEQLVFRAQPVPLILFHQFQVRKSGLRVFV